MTNYIQIQTTLAKREDAEKLAGLLLDHGLVACGQISEIVSLYNWDGKRQQEKEFLLVLKTRIEAFAEVEAVIKANHSYDCPQIIALPIVTGSAHYLAWIEESVGDQLMADFKKYKREED